MAYSGPLFTLSGSNFEGTPESAAPSKAVMIAGKEGTTLRVPYTGFTADGQGNVEALYVAARIFGYNNSAHDYWRNNTEGTLLASAARTVSTPSPNQTNFNAIGVIITLDITANPGGTETLTLSFAPISPVTGSASYHAIQLVTQSALNAIYRLTIYPGANATPDVSANQNAFRPAVVPKTWVATIVHSGAGSWTYSLGYQYVL